MKKTYPMYTSSRTNPEAPQVFNSLSKINQKAILNFMDIVSVNAKSEKRRTNLKRALIKFFDFIEKDWNKITYEDFVATAKALNESSLGTDTRNVDKNIIKRFLQENFEDWRTRFKDMKLMKFETKTEEHRLSDKDMITSKELDRLVKSTTNMKYKALLLLLFESAARPEEILKLRWNDIDLNKNLVYLYSGKTTKKRAIPINDCVVHLRRLKEESEPNEDEIVFPSNQRAKEQMSNAGFNHILNTLRIKAKIQRKITGYTFRHTRLSQLITKLSPKVYEDIAGHSLSMGMKTYAHLSQDIHIKEMQEKIFNVEEIPPSQFEEIKQGFAEWKLVKEFLLSSKEQKSGNIIIPEELYQKLSKTK